MDALVLSLSSFAKLSQNCQAEILRIVSGIENPLTTHDELNENYSEGATALSEREMRKFLEGVSPKTRAFLVGLAEMPARFNVGALLKKMQMQYADIRGILAGLTKRTRTISGDTKASFFESVVWDDDIDKCISEIHPDTHRSLRQVLSKKK